MPVNRTCYICKKETTVMVKIELLTIYNLKDFPDTSNVHEAMVEHRICLLCLADEIKFQKEERSTP